MATLFVDYQQLVRQAYERKRANNTLPLGLIHLTPGNLKEECVKKCTQQVNKRDEKIIRDFCGDLNESKSCHLLMQKCDTDKFRPLVNFLKGKSEKPVEKNVELLAWLIDFSGRPWEMGKTVSGDDDTDHGPALQDVSPATRDTVMAADTPLRLVATEDHLPTENPAIPENPENPVIPAGDPGVKERKDVDVGTDAQKTREKSVKKLAAAIMLSLVVGTGGMWWWKESNPMPGSGACMYWLEDHYEPIACNKKLPNTTIIPVDSMKLKYFRKINTPDTITYQAVGKVWYSKIKGKMEYYTLAGEHPVMSGYQLRPITPYIITVHILSGVSAKQ
ncbi:hypothetical protein ACTJJB_10335 [Chitinophaga sp. 22536]|uniref:hypothetical protein n=1 Tax=unclassified Chitinophaga TaxID=2619133 RepID=UPI003F8362EB